jgi:hypothetical protein
MAPVDDLTVPSWRVLLSGGRLPKCLESALHTAQEWMDIYRQQWAAERLLTADGTRAQLDSRIRTF